MAHLLITGTSKGIGLAMARQALENGHQVVGVARSAAALDHPGYTHRQLDLAQASEEDLQALMDLLPASGDVALVNNAGVLDPVKPFGGMPLDQLVRIYRLNVAVVASLMSLFVGKYKQAAGQRVVLNISSGVATYPIDGWAAYCSSKAAVEMLTQVAKTEEETYGWGIHHYAVAPGIVDTPMQGHIRSQSAEDFSQVQRFLDYKAEGELAQPEEVAPKLLTLVERPADFAEWRYDVRHL